MTYRITPLHVGTITRKKSNMIYGCGIDDLQDFPLIVFLLEDGHEKILVDTGGSAPGTKWMPYVRPAEQDLDAQLLAHSVRPEEITHVIFTHLHWDHAGNNHLFPQAEFLVQRKEYEPIAAKELPGFERELIMDTDYQLIDGDTKDILPGISVMLTPGHSAGSQTVLVNTAEGTIALAGDLIPTYENIEKNVPNGGNYDIDLIRNSMERVLKLGYKILPGHDLG